MKTSFYTLIENPEIIRLILLNSPDAKTYGSLLLSNKIFSLSLSPHFNGLATDKEYMKTRFSEKKREEFAIKGKWKEFFVLPKGEKHGPFVSFESNFSMTKRKTYIDGKKEGPFKKEWYNKRGERSIREGYYINGKKEGKWTEFKNEHLCEECHYVNNKLDGHYKAYWISFSFTSHKLFTEGDYIKGKRDGFWKMWNEEGQLWNEGHYKEDKKHGLWKEYFS